MFYALLAIILMSLDFRERWVDQMRSAAGLLVEPVVLLLEWPYRLGSDLGAGLRSHQQLLHEARVLRQDLAVVSAELMTLAELAVENAELRELLDAGQRTAAGYIVAEVRHVDLNPFSHRVLINRGRRDGLVTGQAVIDARGLVGQVDEVFLHTSRVVLLTDPDHALPVRIQRTGLRTIAYGSGLNDLMRLTDLPMNVDLEPGDLVLTSGLGGVFPPGLPVASVETVERPSGEAFANAGLAPIARPDRSRHLLVLEAVVELADAEGPEAESAAPEGETTPSDSTARDPVESATENQEAGAEPSRPDEESGP